MFCSNCGKMLPDGARFCGSCGTALISVGERRGEEPAAASAAPADQCGAAAGTAQTRDSGTRESGSPYTASGAGEARPQHTASGTGEAGPRHTASGAGELRPSDPISAGSKGRQILAILMPAQRPGASEISAAVVSLLQIVSLLIPAGYRGIAGTGFSYSYGRLMLSPNRPAVISGWGIAFVLLAVLAALVQAYFYLHREKKRALFAGIASAAAALYAISVYIHYDDYGGTDYIGKWIYPAMVVIAILFSLNWEKLKKD